VQLDVGAQLLAPPPMKRPRAVEVALGSLHLSSGDVEEWLRPLQRREIRRDLRKYAAHPTPGAADAICSPRPTRSPRPSSRCSSSGQAKTG
jgi:hypothetical protein